MPRKRETRSIYWLMRRGCKIGSYNTRKEAEHSVDIQAQNRHISFQEAMQFGGFSIIRKICTIEALKANRERVAAEIAAEKNVEKIS